MSQDQTPQDSKPEDGRKQEQPNTGLLDAPKLYATKMIFMTEMVTEAATQIARLQQENEMLKKTVRRLKAELKKYEDRPKMGRLFKDAGLL